MREVRPSWREVQALQAVQSVDTNSIVTEVTSVKQARALPSGTIVGDHHGGLTFTDSVAAALESRSLTGWQELESPSGEIWTYIILNR